jgi:ABC-type nitrate/sulfonate/bicarbonate transport system substrate-binding protein
MNAHILLAGALAAAASLPLYGQSPALRVMGFSGSSNWPIFVAQEKGLFARHGVEVRLSPAPNSATQLASLIDARIDIA